VTRPLTGKKRPTGLSAAAAPARTAGAAAEEWKDF